MYAVMDETSRSSPAPDHVVDAVVGASRALVAITARSLASYPDVTLPQYRLLVVLVTRGPQRLGDLAGNLGVNPSTASRMCDRLSRKGLVHRRRPDGDRRVVELVITEDGDDLVQQVMERRRVEISRILAELTPTEQTSVASGLQLLADASGETHGDLAGDEPPSQGHSGKVAIDAERGDESLGWPAHNRMAVG